MEGGMSEAAPTAGVASNYEYCAEWVRGAARGAPVVVLDYGCGAGEIVRELGDRNIEAFGCDVFYEGGDYSPAVRKDWLGRRIFRIDESTIPFPSEHFDFIVNNQVLEHVEDLDVVLREMRRVLKPGGSVLSLFPDRAVWREGHCGIPFLHRFPKGSSARVYYAAAMRAAGLGHCTENKGIMEWSRDFCEWLDRWTFYRPYRELAEKFEVYFSPLQHLEEHWLSSRLGSRAALVEWCPAPIRRLAVSKLAGRIFVCSKPGPALA
jgi:SAM-dependent methyltransferase